MFRVKLSFILLVFVLKSAFPAVAGVMDKNLLACIDQHADQNGWTSASQFITLTCHNKKIRSVAGLEAYQNLEKLSLHKNDIESFDPTPFKRLKHLNLARNRLRIFRVDGHPLLQELFLFNNQIKRIHLHHLPALERLKANSNGMTIFDYSDLRLVKKVYLFDNELKDIDIENLPALRYMDVRENPMPDELYEAMDKLPGATILHDGNAEDWDP